MSDEHTIGVTGGTTATSGGGRYCRHSWAFGVRRPPARRRSLNQIMELVLALDSKFTRMCENTRATARLMRPPHEPHCRSVVPNVSALTLTRLIRRPSISRTVRVRPSKAKLSPTSGIR